MAVKAYKNEGDIGRKELYSIANDGIAPWGDGQTTGGNACYKLAGSFYDGNIPDADLMIEVQEHLELCRRLSVSKRDRRELKATIHNLDLLIELAREHSHE